jgi:hypothetical protein
MRRLVTARLSSNWSKLLKSLLRDLAPLGHYAKRVSKGRYQIALAEIGDFPRDETGRVYFYDAAHEVRHAAYLLSRAEFIETFEAQHADIFVRMELFQPSAILPSLEIIDFNNPRHRAIVEYLCLYQTVTSRKRVGRQMGLLAWDAGQSEHRPLIGGAILASPRWSLELRDHYLGWPRYFPKTSRRHNRKAKAIREAGLGRMMQLSVACALPPYNMLSGAWLMALTPFTELGQQAFAYAARRDADPDLAVVVTTTGKGLSGAPFRNHRLKQLCKDRNDTSGNVFVRAAPTEGIPALRASFKDLISPKTVKLARKLFRAPFPKRSRPVDQVNDMAIKNMLRRFQLKPDIFDGNEIGIHVGILSAETKQHLSRGTLRPPNKRARLDWDHVTAIWLRKFLPQSESESEEHKRSRRRREERARTFPEEQIRLSYHLSHPRDRARSDTEHVTETH